MWVDHTIWWHVYPLGFTGAPIRPSSNTERRLTPRLRHIVEWLDYLIELGANGLSLGPIFTSHSHGYDTVDHFTLDPRLGEDADFDLLITACHERGIAVMLDGVFNHVGAWHPLFVKALDEGPSGPLAGMFTLYEGGNYEMFEGHPQLPCLNHDDPRVVELVTNVMLHWLRRGASAWRLDAAYAVPPEFWSKVLPRVREEFGETWVMGEVIHGDYPQIIATSGMDSLTQYWLWKAIWSSIKDRNFYELESAFNEHNGLLDSFTPHTFIGNHDVTRVASQVGDRQAVLAAVILLTVGGIPSIYYGDEQGFQAFKDERPGGDDAVRPMFPAHASQLAPYGAWLFDRYRELIALRRRHPWLVQARTETVHLTNTVFIYDVVADNNRLRVELTLEDRMSAKISSEGREIFCYES